MTTVRKLDGVVYRETPEKDVKVDLYLPEDEREDSTADDASGATGRSGGAAGRSSEATDCSSEVTDRSSEATDHSSEPTGRPAVILVHGGGWQNDHHGMCEPHLQRLAEQGYVGAEFTHRLSDEATYPAAIEDVEYGVRWLKSRADEYGIDPERIAIGGHSAGGHLAALVAVSSDDAGFVAGGGPDESSSVAAAIPINGLFNLEKLGQLHPSRLFVSGFIRNFFGGEYLEHRDAYREASCITHVDGDEPPFLVLAGTHDEEVPPYESMQLRDQLEHAGGDPELLLADGGDHFCFVDGGSHYEEGMAQIEDFLDEHLR